MSVAEKPMATVEEEEEASLVAEEGTTAMEEEAWRPVRSPEGS